MSQNKKNYSIPSPIGCLHIQMRGNKICAIAFTESEQEISGIKPAAIKLLEQQLAEYFDGMRKEFTVPYELESTDFQKSVWQKLNQIDYGKTISYGKFAARLGDVKKVRAVANAIGKNPLPILIPCHRVVGIHGHLTGYVGGLARKKYLIEREHHKQLNIFAK